MIRSLPKWYVIALSVLFITYLGGWFYTIHLARVQEAAGAEYVMPVGPHDSSSYADLSDSLLYRNRFAEQGQAYETFLTPGYPVFVSVIRFLAGGSFFAVTFAQILLVFAISLMTRKLGTKLVSERAGNWASLFLLANPLVPSIAFYILTDTLFAFLLTLGFLLIVTELEKRPYRMALIIGLVFAVAAYVRPVGFVAYPIFIAPLLVTKIEWRKKIALACIVLGTVTILLVPWMLRNKEHTGVFGFSSLVELNFSYYTIPHFWNWREGLSLEDGLTRVEQESGVSRQIDARGYPAGWYDLTNSPALGHYIKHVILSQPVTFVSWYLYNSTGFFLNPAINPPHQSQNLKQLVASGQWGAFITAFLNPWWLFVERVGILCAILLAALGFWHNRRNLYAWAFAFVIIYLAALGGVAAQARYRLPVEPLLALFIVSGIITLVSMAHASSSTGGFTGWLMRTPLLKGIRGAFGGKMVMRAIEAKRGTVLYFNEPERAKLLDHYRSIKKETRILLVDAEAIQISEAVRAANKIPGAIGEVGTFRGGSARLMAEASEGKKDIHTFDTFEGLPPLEEFDAKRFTEGQFATSEDAVRAYLKPFPSVHIYKGFFPDSAGPIKDTKFSFVHLDVDIYTSTKDSLIFFYPRMNPGGIIISHDYANAEGVRRAFDEFFADKPEAVIGLSGSQCLVVKI